MGSFFGFPTNILYTFLFSIRAACPAHLILLHAEIIKKFKGLKKHVARNAADK
jgi:hypothetical protein